MRFALSSEQEAFRDTARRFLAERVRLRETIELPGAHDPELWKTIARMGWLDPYGRTFVETAVLAEETGRALLPGPFLGTLIAIEALLVAGRKDLTSRVLPALAAGDRLAAVALGSRITLLSDRLRGEATAVPCAEIADVFLVLAAMPEAMTPFLVAASEVALEPAAGADLTRPIATARFDHARYEERLDGSTVPALLDRARVLVAAELVGTASKALEMAVAYAKERQQFDRAIGSFQAVKHRAADSWRAVEAARLAVWYAAWAIANDTADAPAAAAAAKAAAGDAAVRATTDSIQIHGGIGFTWEHDAHLYYRRAIAGQAFLGGASAERDALAAHAFARA
jgi:alkylation response protein AidB-like acyl-CoA dehydrogenase